MPSPIGFKDLMIAIDIDEMGEGLAKRLRDSLGLGSADVIALSEEDSSCRGADILVVSQVKRDRLSKVLSSEVKWVHALSTGVDGFPFDVLGDRVLTCSRGANAIPIAEFVLASMLAFEKKLPEVWIDKADDWKQTGLGTLEGRVLGLIGMGAIGTEVARRALAFDMEVVAFRRTKSPSPLTGVAVAEDLADVLGVADHLVVAAPSTKETHHLLDEDAFLAMKPGVHLINISRGALVDQDALVEALDSKRVAIATLDVAEPEPLPAGHRLYSHPLVRLSPHVSWSSPTSMRRSVELFEECVRLHMAGSPLPGIVDVEAGY